MAKKIAKKIQRTVRISFILSENEYLMLLKDMRLGEKKSEYIRRKLFKKG